MIELFNMWHWILLGTTVGIIAVLCLVFAVFLRRKSRWISWGVIFGLLVVGLVFHFLCLAFGADTDYPYGIRYVTPISVCAFNILFFPIIFLTKSKVLKDYMFFIGILAGLFAMIVPTDILGLGLGAGGFETIRYFIVNGILCAAPLLMVLCGHHKISWRRCWTPALVLIGVLCVIVLNDVALYALGIYDYAFAGHMYPVLRDNASIAYAPDDAWGFIADVFRFLTPEFLRTAPFDTNYGVMQGDVFYIPVVWAVIPVFVLCTLACLLVSIIFDARRFGRDMKKLWYTVTFQKEKCKKMSKKLSRLKG